MLISFGALLFYGADQITDDLPDSVVDGAMICFSLFIVLLAAANFWLQRQLTRHVQANDRLHASELTLLKQNEELEIRIAREIAHREIAQTRLARAERMEALGKLAGGIAHDFNNLLQIISSSTTLLQPHVPEKHRKRFEPIIRATERGARVVDQLLTFARRSDSEPQLADVGVILQEVADILMHSLPPEIAVTCEVAEDLPRAYLDPARLGNVIINLAHNSRDAMPHGGHLALRAELMPLDGRSKSGLPEEAALCISVADDGQGIHPITLSHAAEPFFTTKPEGKGTGLGLSMALGYVEQLGGRFDISSNVGAGTTVKLIIPPSPDLTEMAQDVDLVQRISGRHQDVSGLKVMLVEHNLLLRELLAEELSELGAAVVQAASATDALALLNNDSRFDAVITDYRMPGMNGRRLIAELQHQYPKICAVLLTGLSDPDEPAVGEPGQPKPDSILKKPVTGAEILYTVRDLVGQKRSE